MFSMLSFNWDLRVLYVSIYPGTRVRPKCEATEKITNCQGAYHALQGLCEIFCGLSLFPAEHVLDEQGELLDQAGIVSQVLVEPGRDPLLPVKRRGINNKFTKKKKQEGLGLTGS